MRASVPVENIIGKENHGFAVMMTNFLHGELYNLIYIFWVSTDPSTLAERLLLCIQANRMSRICIEDAYELAQSSFTSRAVKTEALPLSRYAASRKTFGKRLLDQPVIRAKVRSLPPSSPPPDLNPSQLSDMGRIVESNHSWIEQICHHIDKASKADADLDLAGIAALCKVSCTRGLEFCNREALQILGGVGYQRGGVGGRVEQM